MLTGELRNQIDGIWNDFWSGGLANPLQVIEQITCLIFIKRLDEMQVAHGGVAQRLERLLIGGAVMGSDSLRDARGIRK
jgi:type I restriction enzyme M protein